MMVNGVRRCAFYEWRTPIESDMSGPPREALHRLWTLPPNACAAAISPPCLNKVAGG